MTAIQAAVDKELPFIIKSKINSKLVSMFLKQFWDGRILCFTKSAQWDSCECEAETGRRKGTRHIDFSFILG